MPLAGEWRPAARSRRTTTSRAPPRSPKRCACGTPERRMARVSRDRGRRRCHVEGATRSGAPVGRWRTAEGSQHDRAGDGRHAQRRGHRRPRAARRPGAWQVQRGRARGRGRRNSVRCSRTDRTAHRRAAPPPGHQRERARPRSTRRPPRTERRDGAHAPKAAPRGPTRDSSTRSRPRGPSPSPSRAWPPRHAPRSCSIGRPPRPQATPTRRRGVTPSWRRVR
jgi:hypothetical protein